MFRFGEGPERSECPCDFHDDYFSGVQGQESATEKQVARLNSGPYRSTAPLLVSNVLLMLLYTAR